jgi:two-component system response regulator YesN
MMYRIIIVDDEKQILDGLSKMIKWDDMGFEVCAAARNGLEAIPLIREYRPDVVLTDIRMPKMDGLALLKHVRENMSKDMEFIILSGYSEFQYAQKAMQYNVKNYILKPIDEVLLYGTLVDIKNELDHKNIRKSIVFKSYINSIVRGDMHGGSELDLENEEVYGLRYITLERHVEFEELIYQEEEYDKNLFNALSKKIGASKIRFIQQFDKNKCFIVVGQSLLSLFEYDIRILAENIFTYLTKNCGIPVDILVGKKVKTIQQLHESVQSIAVCKNKQFYQKKTSVIFYDDIKNTSFCKIYEDNGLVIRVISAFKKNDMEKLVQAVEQLMHQFHGLMVVPEIALIHLDSIMASIIQILSERTEETGEIVEKYSIYKKLQNRLKLFNLIELLIKFCFFCNEFSLSKSRDENLDIIEKVIKYVDENYMYPLKIINLAENFYVNPAYLGQQFIKKKNCSLNYYINSVRIEKSKELLLNSNLKIYEIARKVGFDDPNYFSAKFLEFTKTTPSDFRKIHFSADKNQIL